MRPNVLRNTVNSHWPLASNFYRFCCLFFGFVLLCESFLFPKQLIFLNLRKYSTEDAASPVSSVALAEYQLESLNSALSQNYDIAQGNASLQNPVHSSFNKTYLNPES